MSFIDKTNIVIKKNNNDLYYFDIDKDIVLTKINNKNDILLPKILSALYCMTGDPRRAHAGEPHAGIPSFMHIR